MRNYVEILLSGFLIIVVAGCLEPPHLPDQYATGESPGSTVLDTNWKMAVGDEVQINVWKNPELSVTVPIRPDGKIAMPLIGDVLAAGRTPEYLAAQIKRELSTYIKNPNVTVILTNLQGQEFLSRIRVTGAVGNNISIPYRQGMTVLDAVLEAGGVDVYADSNHTKLHRRSSGTNLMGDEVETYDIRLEDILEDGDMTTNVLLLPGDVITVPERQF
jgi:polysaccharide export outer membrane protein